ncbi:MAG: HAMP domain-containing histidine kinase, partial [Spirochaetales bacterium]|nr:HAMP domain-containing histidine kinase [Spirochaetales bacterium]
GLIYPSAEIPLSRKEETFLTRIKETDISFNFLQKSETEESGKTIRQGWHTWFMGDGINFIYWQKKETSANELVIEGIELNRSALLSKIINSLPETNEDNSSIRITVLDVSGNILYQWGSWSPANNIVSNSVMPLNYPVSSWHLEYFMDPSSFNTGGNTLFLTISLLTMLLVIIALSIYLYRESTKEMREAAQKVSFVNQVSHELKTPLTNIRMYAELLEERFAKEDRKTKKHLNIIISETGRLGRLINNVLSFAKEQKNGVTFNPVPVVPDEIITRLLDSFTYSLKSKGIKLHTKLKASNTVMLDTDILEQILSNLISNVEKYAADGKWIKVESSLMDEIFKLTVRDRGPGIPENLKDKIFEPFFRVSNKLTDGVSGTGIGLSLVRTLTEIHGGNVVFLPADAPGSNTETSNK